MSTRGNLLTWITTPLLLLVFFVCWDVYVSAFKVSRFVLPPPMEVLKAFWGLLLEASTWRHAAVTIYETLFGFVIATVFGVGLGALLAKVPLLERVLSPFIIATQVVPKVALIPLFILWFGFGPTSKIVVAAVLAFFPIMANTLLGFKSIESGHSDVMLSLNATTGARARFLELPASLPYIMSGMEVGIVLAIIGAVVGEYLGGNVGLGHLAVASLNSFQVDLLFATILLLTVIGFLLYLAVVGLKRWVIPWHQSSGQVV